MNNNYKICSSSSLAVFAHTAKCEHCSTLLYYLYPDDDKTLMDCGRGKVWPRNIVLDWHSKSSFRNDDNFTHMLRFMLDQSFSGKKLNILDYRGGGGNLRWYVNHIFQKLTYLLLIFVKSHCLTSGIR